MQIYQECVYAHDCGSSYISKMSEERKRGMKTDRESLH